MNQTIVRPALLALVKQLSGLDCVWRDQPQHYVPPKGYGEAVARVKCMLSLGPSSGKGRDELRTAYDADQPNGQEMQDTSVGVRLFTLKIVVESFDQNDGLTAEQHLERIRDRMRWRSSTDALDDVNVAFVTTGEIQDLTTTRDNRKVSIAALDIRLSGMSVDTDPARYGYIETVDINGPVEP